MMLSSRGSCATDQGQYYCENPWDNTFLNFLYFCHQPKTIADILHLKRKCDIRQDSTKIVNESNLD